MDNNVFKEMGLEMKDQQSENIKTNTEKQSTDSNSAENTLIIIGEFILVLGILATLIMLFSICFIKEDHYYSDDEYKFSPMGFAVTCITFLSSLVTWASMRVLANISITLKDIKNK